MNQNGITQNKTTIYGPNQDREKKTAKKKTKSYIYILYISYSCTHAA